MRTVVLLVAVALLAAGCGSSTDEAEPTPTPTTATTTPANPDATEPTLPDVGKEETDAGAIAFTQYFLQVLDYAEQTGDVEALEAMSTPGCEGCHSYIDYDRALYAKGGWAKGGMRSMADVSVVRANSDGVDRHVVYLTLNRLAGKLAESGTTSPEPYDAVSHKVYVELGYANEWHIREYGFQE